MTVSIISSFRFRTLTKIDVNRRKNGRSFALWAVGISHRTSIECILGFLDPKISMEAIKRVVELNAAACIALHEGSLETSVQLLRSALDIYRVELTGYEKGELHLELTQTELDNHLLAVSAHETLCDDAQVSPGNIYSCFNVAFCFEAMADVDCVALVCLYNYGLSLHRRGMTTGRDSDLRKAIQLYSMAIGLLSDEALASRYELGRVGLALLTNLTQLYHHFLQYDQVERCLRYLRHMLELRQEMDISVEEFGFFYSVVFFSSDQVSASPAPAA